MKQPARKPVGKREAAAIATLYIAGMATHADTSEAFDQSGLTEDEIELIGEEIVGLGERMAPGVPMSVFCSTKSIVEHVREVSVRNAMAPRKPRKVTRVLEPAPTPVQEATPEQVVRFWVEVAGEHYSEKLTEDFVVVLAGMWDTVKTLPLTQITLITLAAVKVAGQAGMEGMERLMRGNRVKDIKGGLFNGGFQKLIDEALSLRPKDPVSTEK